MRQHARARTRRAGTGDAAAVTDGLECAAPTAHSSHTLFLSVPPCPSVRSSVLCSSSVLPRVCCCEVLEPAADACIHGAHRIPGHEVRAQRGARLDGTGRQAQAVAASRRKRHSLSAVGFDRQPRTRLLSHSLVAMRCDAMRCMCVRAGRPWRPCSSPRAGQPQPPPLRQLPVESPPLPPPSAPSSDRAMLFIVDSFPNIAIAISKQRVRRRWRSSAGRCAFLAPVFF